MSHYILNQKEHDLLIEAMNSLRAVVNLMIEQEQLITGGSQSNLEIIKALMNLNEVLATPPSLDNKA